MSRVNRKKQAWTGWIVSIILIAVSITLWTQRQYVVDAIQVQQYTPSSEVKRITSQSGMTDDAKFTFYATRPSIEPSNTFNRHCERKEADSPILGCYAAGRIYVFDVAEPRLDGIMTVTAAHEMLHAEYERLPSSERERVNKLLRAAYKRVTTPELEERMDYYSKNQPGQNLNELHSILGTEFNNLGVELEVYYKKYFTDRQALVERHDNVSRVFDELSEQADDLVDRIEKLAYKINTESKQYNSSVSELNDAVTAFNSRARSNGGFATQAEFDQARGELSAQSDQLAASRQQIQQDVAQYKVLLSQLDAINAESADLNRSLDSTLSDVPKI